MQDPIAIVSLRNIEKNAMKVKKLLSPKTKFYAVVKANAYGHGICPVAERLEKTVDGFCVTTVLEGVTLRQSGIEKEILSFTPPLEKEDVFWAITHGISLTVNSLQTARLIINTAEAFDKKALLHLKVNTGMNRLGLSVKDLISVCKLVKQSTHVQVDGVYSHLYLPNDRAESELQRKKFAVCESVVKTFYPTVTAHLSASGGVLNGKDFFFDGVRVGIMLYGYFPYKTQTNVKLSPAMKLYAPCIQKLDFIGGGIGYQKAQKEYKKLYSYRIGYADGLNRTGKAELLQAEGTLCMDSCISRQKGREGGQKLVFSDAEKYAERTGTIVYDVLVNAGRRAEFRYE